MIVAAPFPCRSNSPIFCFCAGKIELLLDLRQPHRSQNFRCASRYFLWHRDALSTGSFWQHRSRTG